MTYKESRTKSKAQGYKLKSKIIGVNKQGVKSET